MHRVKSTECAPRSWFAQVCWIAKPARRVPPRNPGGSPTSSSLFVLGASQSFLIPGSHTLTCLPHPRHLPIPSPATSVAAVSVPASPVWRGAPAARVSARVTLFEAGDYFGGHDPHGGHPPCPPPTASVTHGVDTGFLVLNEQHLSPLVGTTCAAGCAHCALRHVSLSVQVPGAGRGVDALERSGTSLSTVFAQRRNLLNGRFWRMLADLLRFNRPPQNWRRKLDQLR